MHSVVKVLRIAACCLALLGSATVRAFADSSTPSGSLVAAPESDQPADMIGRGYFELGMDSGQARSVRVAVKNDSRDPMTIRVYPVDAVALPGGGIDFNTADRPVVGTGTWLALDSSTLQLAPGESRRVTATITVAANATPGDHVAGIAVENAQPSPNGVDSQVVINVSYRRAIAVVVAVTGERTAALAVDALALSQDARGNRAVVQVRNTGNSLLKAKGTVEISGAPAAGSAQTSGSAQTFSIDTLIPGTGAGVAVRLPGVLLAPGTYNAHVVLQTEDGHALADWQGSAAFVGHGQADPAATPPSDVSLVPINASTSAATSIATLSDLDAAALALQAATPNPGWWWLLGIPALLLLLRSSVGRLLRRTR